MGNYLTKTTSSDQTCKKNTNLNRKKAIKRKYVDNLVDQSNSSSYYLSKLFSSSPSKSQNSDTDSEENDDYDQDDDEFDELESSKNKRSKANESNYSSSILMKPTRKRMKSTSSYIYKTLFLNGENSDIKVKAMNKEWNLHKIYLCQSPYFDSMFKGSKWKESNQSCIEIAVPDQNINLNALDITFGSFYTEDINIIPIESINILACASLFSLDGLINQCACVMIENMNSESVFAFYEASLTYGLKNVTEKAINWLCTNLMSNENIRLADISFSLFEKIISSETLMIIQVETDIYSICKKWLYYQMNKSETDKPKVTQKDINDYFKAYLATINKKEDNESNKCLLEHDQFSLYVSIFKKVRFQHVITDYASLKLIYSDKIVPHHWLEKFYFKNWMNLIYIDQDKFSHEFEIDENVFESECLRFGRLLNENDSTWRWVGFNYGLDLIVSHVNRTLVLRRNTLHGQSPNKGLCSNKNIQRIYYSITLIQLDSLGNQVWHKKTEIKCLDLNRNEEKMVEKIDACVKYPIVLNLKLLTYPLRLSNLLMENQL